MRRRTAAVAVLAAGAVVSLILVRRHAEDVPSRPSRERPPRADAPRTRLGPDPAGYPPSDAPTAAASASSFDALDAAVRGADAAASRQAAAELRGLLRRDPRAWEEAVHRLGDGSTSEDSRAALALILGTIDAPRTDAALVGTLAAARGSPVLERALLLALGATRDPPDDDDVFDLGDRPWGENGPGGLGITVRRAVPDEATRREIEKWLRAGTPATRAAAATTLRHTLTAPDVRQSFEEALAAETADAPAAVLGEALAIGARRSADTVDRDRTLRAIFAKAGLEGFDGLRLRVIDDLAGVPLPPDSARTLATWAEAPGDFGRRSFALDVLAGSAAADETTRGVARPLLARLLGSDADPAIRDTAARLLRKALPDGAAGAALLRAVREDAAWNVRHAALETLVAAERPEAATALDAASRDPDERVRELAARVSRR